MRKLVVIVFLCIGIVLSIKEVFLKKDNVRNSLLLYNIEALAADIESSGSWNFPSSNEDALQHARPALAQAWRSFLDYNPHSGVLAAVTQLDEVLEIYNLKDSTHVVRISKSEEPEFKVSDGYGLPTGIMGFSDVQVLDNDG